jgi:hypothetical protein
MRKIEYWENVLRLDSFDTTVRLAELGVTVSPSMRVLPKGALSKLRKADLLSSAVTISDGNQSKIEAEQLEPEPEFVWKIIGHEAQCNHLSTDEIVQIHNALELEFSETLDPIFPLGVRSINLLESAAYRPLTRSSGQVKYPTPQMGAAALLHSLTQSRISQWEQENCSRSSTCIPRSQWISTHMQSTEAIPKGSICGTTSPGAQLLVFPPRS